MPIHLCLPRNGAPPSQAVVHVPTDSRTGFWAKKSGDRPIGRPTIEMIEVAGRWQ